MSVSKYKKNITIVVPTLNSFKILERLVKSLKAQSTNNWKVIFVDGYSKKEHTNWLTQLCKKDNRFKWISQSFQSQGIFGAMNDGINEIKESSWVMFWGSDDWCNSNNVIENLYENLNKIYSSGLKIDLLINKARFFSKELKIGRDFKFNLIQNNFRKSLFWGEIPAHQGVVFNSDLFKEDLYLDSYKIASDLEFFLRLANKKIKIKYTGETIVSMLEGGESQTFFIKKIKEVFKIYELHFSILFIIPFTMRYLKKIFNV